MYSEYYQESLAAVEAAREHGVNLYASDKPAFELCGEISALL